MRSWNLKFFITARSALCCPSARSSVMRLAAVPTVYGGGALNTEVLNQRSGVGLSSLTRLLLVIFGGCVPENPYCPNELGAVMCTGNPLANRMIPAACQPPITKSRYFGMLLPN